MTIRIISCIQPDLNKTIIMSTTHSLKLYYLNFSTHASIIRSGTRIPTTQATPRNGELVMPWVCSREVMHFTVSLLIAITFYVGMGHLT